MREREDRVVGGREGEVEEEMLRVGSGVVVRERPLGRVAVDPDLDAAMERREVMSVVEEQMAREVKGLKR